MGCESAHISERQRPTAQGRAETWGSRQLRLLLQTSGTELRGKRCSCGRSPASGARGTAAQGRRSPPRLQCRGMGWGAAPGNRSWLLRFRSAVHNQVLSAPTRRYGSDPGVSGRNSNIWGPLKKPHRRRLPGNKPCLRFPKAGKSSPNGWKTQPLPQPPASASSPEESFRPVTGGGCGRCDADLGSPPAFVSVLTAQQTAQATALC